MPELIELNVQNLTILLIVTNLIWLFFVNKLRTIMGQNYFSTILVALRRGFKKPATYIKFYKSRYYELEVRDTIGAPTFDKDKKIPIKLDESKRFNHEGPYKAYVLLEGQTGNIDPSDVDAKSYEHIQRIGIVNNYVLDIEKERMRKQFENELLTKKHFNIGIAVVVIGLVIIGAMNYPVVQFVDAVSKQIETYRPLLDEALKSVPRIEPTTAGNDIANGIISAVQK